MGYSPWGRKQSDATAHTLGRDYGNGVLQPPEGSRRRNILFLSNDAKAETPVVWPPHVKS